MDIVQVQMAWSFRVIGRFLKLLPFGVFAQILYLRLVVDYQDYLKAAVGSAVYEKGMTETWAQDAALWSAARAGYWIDLAAVATNPTSLASTALIVGLIAVFTNKPSMSRISAPVIGGASGKYAGKTAQ